MHDFEHFHGEFPSKLQSSQCTCYRYVHYDWRKTSRSVNKNNVCCFWGDGRNGWSSSGDKKTHLCVASKTFTRLQCFQTKAVLRFTAKSVYFVHSALYPRCCRIRISTLYKYVRTIECRTSSQYILFFSTLHWKIFFIPCSAVNLNYTPGSHLNYYSYLIYGFQIEYLTVTV